MSEIVYLNGAYANAQEALISPNDRGFLFADGVYEVIKYYNGRPFRLSDHLERLQRSVEEVQIRYNRVKELEGVFLKLLQENDRMRQHAGIYVQITRGTTNRVHHFPHDLEPTVYAYAFAMPSDHDKLIKGIKVITHEDIRWLRCDIKSVSLLANTMVYNKAAEAGAGECILIREGYVTEATHSSLFAVMGDKVVTHPLNNRILPGITRKVILEICAENNLVTEERALSEKELYQADELFIAGTGSEITPVTEVDGRPVGNKKPGIITRFLQDQFFVRT